MKDEALDLALEALEELERCEPSYSKIWSLKDSARKAITVIKQARALDKKAENARELGLDYEPEERYTYGTPLLDAFTKPAPVQEPVAAQCRFPAVAWAQCDVEHARMVMANPHEWKGYEVRLLYTTPPAAQRQWVSLTDEQIKRAKPVCADFVSFRAGVRYAEARYKERQP